jgi:hypothetical protein
MGRRRQSAEVCDIAQCDKDWVVIARSWSRVEGKDSVEVGGCSIYETLSNEDLLWGRILNPITARRLDG